MQAKDYPALYCAADAASNEAQANLLNFFRLNSILLVSAAITALASPMTTWIAILSAILFLGSLVAYIFGKLQNYQGRWYQARALAESIKTATWRLMMVADPFRCSDEEVNLEKFRNLLNELLQENKGIGAYLSGNWSQHDQVTPEMLRISRLTFQEKKDKYLKSRIDEQRTWYAYKSGDNRKKSKIFFTITCVAYGIAIFLVLIRIANPEIKYLPVNALAVVASSIIGWTQLKRFDELSSAYGLTAHELGFIKSRYHSVVSADGLSTFVSDAENAFSREHTQWAARRDH